MGEKDGDTAGYNRAKDEFNRMKLEDQASFLLEATATTVLRGVEQVSASLADELDDWMRRRHTSGTRKEEGPGPAEPETSDSNSPSS